MSNVRLVYTNNNLLIGKLTILDKEPSVLLEDCYLINYNLNTLNCQFVTFPLFSDERYVIINSSNVFTIVEPSSKVIKEYYKILSDSVNTNDSQNQ